jgi:ornithine cyclodeaminase/alanine dehydrogenase-like protein (mu-crystallin family)
VATIAGAGNQGAIQLEAIIGERPLEAIFVWDIDGTRANDFACRMKANLERKGLRADVQPRSDLAAAAKVSDIIVTCTPAKRWFLGRDMVAPGTFVAAIGTDSADKQELEPALLAGGSVVTDITEQAALVGDLHHAIAAGLMTEKDVRGELGAVIIGTAPGRRNDREIIIFDATGTALQDTAAAVVVYEKAARAHRGTPFPFWDVKP